MLVTHRGLRIDTTSREAKRPKLVYYLTTGSSHRLIDCNS